MNVKWVHRLNVTDAPVDARDETSHYTELMPSGKARQYMFLQAVKSAIIKPSFGMTMKGPGLYEISGLAWSGAGKVAKVEVSADGGRTWTSAALTEPVLSKALTRFRLPWQWDGRPAVLASRATDEKGETQPTRAAWVAQYADRTVLPLQRRPKLERRSRRDGEKCLCLRWDGRFRLSPFSSSPPPAWRSKTRAAS